MYKNKKVIIMRRPLWRHPVFPWGWYSLMHDKFEGDEVMSDGYLTPNDGGGGLFKFCPEYKDIGE
jgi:hypothetical protein